MGKNNVFDDDLICHDSNVETEQTNMDVMTYIQYVAKLSTVIQGPFRKFQQFNNIQHNSKSEESKYFKKITFFCEVSRKIKHLRFETKNAWFV